MKAKKIKWQIRISPKYKDIGSQSIVIWYNHKNIKDKIYELESSIWAKLAFRRQVK